MRTKTNITTIDYATVSKLPKYLQVREAIAGQVRRGELATGTQLLPERELMRKYRVSYSTLQRALSELGDAGLIERKWGKGTFVRGERTASVVTTAIVFAQFAQPTHPWMTAILYGIQKGHAELGWHHQLFPLPESTIFGGSKELLLSRLLKEGYMGGIISLTPIAVEDVEELESKGVPLVSVENEYPGRACSCVIENAQSGAEQVISHLVDELGHRKICVVGTHDPRFTARIVTCSDIVAESFEFQLRVRGLKCQTILQSSHTWEDIAPAIAKCLSSPDCPTAMIFYDDFFAYNTVRMAREMNIDVPGDLSVVGWADILHDSQLTTVNVPLMQLGIDASRVLNSVIAGQPQQILRAPVKLVVRQTSGRAAR